MPPDNSEDAKARAEARFQAATQKARAADVAMSEHRKEQDAVLARIAKLKELRLAKEAAEKEAAAAAPKPTTRVRREQH